MLCRYAGLRCPSEVFALRWSDIELDAGRMRVRSPTGENFGKGIREVPLFPEVLLQALPRRLATYEYKLSGSDVTAEGLKHLHGIS